MQKIGDIQIMLFSFRCTFLFLYHGLMVTRVRGRN